MREPILKAVAMPPKFLWAPFLPALANLGVQFPMMFIIMGFVDFNPFLFVISIVAVHAFLAMYGAKEPHLSTLLAAYGPFAGGSKNVYKSKGTKLAP